MTLHERQAIFSISLIYALRMLGVFMILPLLGLYAQGLDGSTPLLIGIAVGIYGLTQAGFQIPWGMLSDSINRKHVIAIGISLFILGSLVAAIFHSITGVIIGRALQGIGAIGSATMALVADATQPSQRTKAMAAVGIAIGGSFSLAMILGPFLNQWLSMTALFWMSAIFGLVCLPILYYGIPEMKWSASIENYKIHPSQLITLLKNKRLLHFNGGVFALHAILTANFVALPSMLQNTLLLPMSHHWKLYCPIFLASVIIILPFLYLAEKKQCIKPVFITGVAFIGISQILLGLMTPSWISIIICLLLFFSAFTLLEAMLPSLISKSAPIENRGTAMGIFSTSQFAGIFLGGLVGGYLYGHHQITELFCINSLITVLWLFTLKSFDMTGENNG